MTTPLIRHLKIAGCPLELYLYPNGPKQMANALHQNDSMPFHESREKNRRALRHAALEVVRSKGLIQNEEENLLLDLSQIPRFNKGSMSLSHCPQASGFALNELSRQKVGFDVEVRDRVTSKIVGRISKEKEVQSAPSPAHLWVAKEASFKALQGEEKIELLSQINVDSWSQKDLIHEFFGHNEDLGLSGRGLVWFEESLILGLFLRLT